MLLERIHKIIPWLSLAWGVVSVFLITHNVSGIHKVILFAALFAAVSLLGLALPKDRLKPLHWIKTISRQGSAQYVLFFALPLLWKAQQWPWLLIVGIVGLSTLWDPLYDSLWKHSWYRIVLVTVSFALVTALSIVVWSPALFQFNLLICLIVCLVSQILPFVNRLKIFAEREENGFRKLNPKDWVSGVVLFVLFVVSGAPLPAVGVWLVEGQIKPQLEGKSLECTSRIAAPTGFKSEIIHRWTIVGEKTLNDEVRLSEIVGNGIDEKPYTTRSRKKTFPMSFDTLLNKKVRCDVIIPGQGSIGAIEFGTEIR